MQSEDTQQLDRSRPTSTNRCRHNYKVSRYSDSFHWPGRSDVKPRIISSNHLSSSKKESSPSVDDFCPYSRLNYADMHLSSSKVLKDQQRRLFSQRITIGLAALMLALAGTGLLWMQLSNAAALESDLLTPGAYEYQID